MNEREIFLQALDIAEPEARAAFLQETCGQDVALRRHVEDLLKEHFSNDSLLAGPALEAGGSETLESAPADSPAQVLGRYKLLEKIGEGGFGEVWMAEQREPVKRRVALKILKLGMDSRQIVARFEAERQALAMMDHANIARIFDADVTDTGRPYFVMELVRGIKITEYCDENQFPTRERLQLFIKVCQAIQHAHQKGVIHRDIKPSNILVTLHDGVPVPKVIDFGIAKATQQELTDKTVFTQFQQFIGTPAYISPEQAEMSGLDIDTRADIYSLGVLLYELMVGQTPFDAREMVQGGLDALRQIIRQREPQRPSTRLNTLAGDARTTAGLRRKTEVRQLVHQLQGDLDWIVMKCLEKDRTRRYDTANGLAMDLQRHLANEPVLARPPSAAYRIQKAWQRNKLGFTAGAAVAVVLIAGIAASTWQAAVATQARTTAQAAQARAEEKQREAEAERSRAETERERADTQSKKVAESQRHSRRLLYAADMNLAQQSLKFNHLGRALRLLDRHRPQPGEEDLRGWEWRYLWQLTRSGALATLTNRPVRGFSVSFSPDGSRLAVGWYGGRVDLWEVPGRRLLRQLADPSQGSPGAVAFSPKHNLLAATSEPDTVTLYDLDSGRESILWKASEQGGWGVIHLSFSPDGSRVVICAGAPPGVGEAWVVNVASSRVESRHPTPSAPGYAFGEAQLSADNRRLYLPRSEPEKNRYRIQCLDLTSGKELWQTEPQRDLGVTALALSPDGRLLASGSGFADPRIRIWDAFTGHLVARVDGPTGWVDGLVFTQDGRRLISAATDQSIRFWDVSSWTQTGVLRGHTDEVHAVAISETAHLLASAGRDGNLMLWRDDGTSVADGYRQLAENLRRNQVQPLDHSRVWLTPTDQSPEVMDLQSDSSPVTLPAVGSSTNILGWFGTNLLCRWNGTNQILVHELRGSKFLPLGALTLNSGIRPTVFAYQPTHQLAAWSEGASSPSIFLATLATPDRRIELKTDATGIAHLSIAADGMRVMAVNATLDYLGVWSVESGRNVVSILGTVASPLFAAGGRVLVVAVRTGIDHEIRFYDLAHPEQAPRRVAGKHGGTALAVSPDGRLVASSSEGGEVRLFDPVKGEWIDSFQGHLNAAYGIDFSTDGRRLISAHGGWDAVKLWDVDTRQELLNLSGIGSGLKVRWSADGNVILAGPPWQAWRAPSWEEIASAEAKEKAQKKQP